MLGSFSGHFYFIFELHVTSRHVTSRSLVPPKQAVPGLRLRGLQVPDVGNEGDAGGEDDGDWDGDDSPKVARGALSKRLMDTRKTSRLDSRRGPIM